MQTLPLSYGQFNMLVFFTEETVAKINEICKISGESNSDFINNIVEKYFLSGEYIKVIDAKSKFSYQQLHELSKLKNTSKVLSLIRYLENTNTSDQENQKYKKIIAMRFGLYDYKPHTLDAIGNEFGVTRERIRQIIARLLIDPISLSGQRVLDEDSEYVVNEQLFNEYVNNAETEIEDEMVRLVSLVAAHFNFTFDQINARVRTADIAFARQFAMFCLSRCLHVSASKIGRFFQKDHTTVLHALSLIESRIQSDEVSKKIYDSVTAKIDTYEIQHELSIDDQFDIVLKAKV